MHGCSLPSALHKNIKHLQCFQETNAIETTTKTKVIARTVTTKVETTAMEAITTREVITTKIRAIDKKVMDSKVMGNNIMRIRAMGIMETRAMIRDLGDRKSVV